MYACEGRDVRARCAAGCGGRFRGFAREGRRRRGQGPRCSAALGKPGVCASWLRKLVSKPEIALRHARLSAPQRVALLQVGSDVAPVDPVLVLTWNVNQKVRPTSAQAPSDVRVWSAADNFEAVQAEVLRLQPDVVSLRGCDGGGAAPRSA